MNFKSHTIKTIQKNKAIIWQTIKENLKTEAITIMNNHEDAKNRNYHKGAHLCAISCNWATEEAKKAGSGKIEQILSKEARKDPKNWSYDYINISTAVGYHTTISEDGDDSVDCTVELRANKYNKSNYILVLKDGKAAFHKIGDLKILESSTSQQGKDVYYLGPLEFKEYKPSGKFNTKYYNNFEPKYLGNYAPNDVQFRGDYAIVIDNGRGAQQFLEGISWKAIAEDATENYDFPLSVNTLCKWVRKNKTVVDLKRTRNGVSRIFTIYIARGENMTTAQVMEYAKKEAELMRQIRITNKIISKENGKVKTVKGSLKTKRWTTLTDKETPEYLLEEDNFKHTQTCVNKPLSVLPTRTNEKVHKQNYLFECDEISLEKQTDIINELPEEMKQAIVWCCYSGSKSIHTVIATNTPDNADSEMRKYIHEELNQTWFRGEADPSGQNAARLARTPNAVRENGRIQKAFKINDDKAIPYDVTGIINEFYEVKARKDEERKKLAEKYRNRNSDGIHTLAQLKSWNESHPSKAKQEAIELLEGNLKDWNRSLAAVRSLVHFGFDECEIETEAPYNDKWVKSALKVVFGK